MLKTVQDRIPAIAFFVSVIVFLFTGCVTHRMYSGPQRARDEIAILRPCGSISVLLINDTKFYDSNSPGGEWFGRPGDKIELLPGHYEIVVCYSSGYWVSTSTITLRLKARAGHIYHIKEKARISIGKGSQWDAWIEDVTK